MKSINYRLWASIALLAFLPAVYATVRVYFVSSIPDTWSVSIAAQSAWLHLAFEVLQEGILLPLYFVFGQVISNLPSLRSRFSAAFGVTVAAFVALTLGIVAGADWLIPAMHLGPEQQSLTARFIRLESVAVTINTLSDICVVAIVALGRYRMVFLLAAIKTAATIALDAFFVGQFSWSMDYGVVGVALTNISAGLILLIPAFWMLHRLGLIFGKREPQSKAWKIEWLKIGIRSGLESGVRNLAFSVMILRMMNEVQEAGLYWVTNAFIWSWLLLPVLTLGTLIRQDVGCNAGKLGPRFMGYINLTVIIAAVWMVSIPGWTWFVANAMGYYEASRVVDLTLILVGFYMVFAFNHVLDSYLYGAGRTDLMLYQSLFVSIVYYGSAFIAYQVGWFVPDVTLIAFLFGGGIVIDSLVTLWQFWRAGYLRQAQEKSKPLQYAKSKR